MLKNTENHYGLVSKSLHWLMAALIFMLIAVGLYMTSLAQDDPSRTSIYFMHKSFGVLAMLLALARLAWLAISPAPRPLAGLEPRDLLIAKGVQGLLYALMLAIPFSGYAISTFAGYPVSLFGLFDMPVLFGKNPELKDLAAKAHELLAWSILAMVALHVLGAIKHRLAGKAETDVLSRML